VFAYLNNLPAGKYRIRIKAENDCLVDEIDIRPSFDAGIEIVGETHPTRLKRRRQKSIRSGCTTGNSLQLIQ